MTTNTDPRPRKHEQPVIGGVIHILQTDGTYVYGGLATVVFPDDWEWQPHPGCNLCEAEEKSGMWSGVPGEEG